MFKDFLTDLFSYEPRPLIMTNTLSNPMAFDLLVLDEKRRLEHNETAYQYRKGFKNN